MAWVCGKPCSRTSGGPSPLRAREDAADLSVDPVAFEAGEEIVAHGSRSALGNGLDVS